MGSIEARGKITRTLYTAFLAFHLLAMTGSIFQGVAPINEVRKVLTRPYERTIGVHQNWTMFVPNPAQSTTWFRAIGEPRSDPGTELELEVLHGRPDPEGVILHYARKNKFDRNMTAKRRDELRAGYVRYLCRIHKEQGVPMSHIAFDAMRMQTPPPGERGEVARSAWPVNTTRLERWRCR